QCANEAGQFLSGVLGSVTGILNEVLAGDLVLGLAALKTRDHYAFEHAVDTAVMGALLAAKIRMESRELRAVAAGSLVMDLGNVVVPPTILNKHGTLSAAEHETMEQHTEAGYEIVRSMGLEDILAAHIPWQYHERQDGKGYPRGLFGNNKLARTRQQLLDGRYILQVAEVAAIANVYDALTSDRPYRDALPAAEAVETLETLAGSHLNREMVAAFISLVPVWPLGTRVRLWGQPWHGSLAVVSEQDRFDANRPVVRLIESVDGDSLDEEVRLVLHSDLELRPSSD
ncbi:MAG TPA: HD domain-containing phosphohydrolase, partial [Dehalococcoidia bacterium]|nr:HD domain-containing phosphohydrolase [Dehalococcoidia bacterium]